MQVSFYILVLGYLFQITNCSFMVIPIKALKRNNIDLNFNDPNLIPYLETNLTEYNFLKEWFMRTSYLELNIGNPFQKVPAEIKNDQNNFVCVAYERYQKDVNINYFNLTKSFKNISIIQKHRKITGVVYVTSEGNDDFYFRIYPDLKSNDYKLQKMNYNFSISFDINNTNGTSVEDITLQGLNFTFSFLFGINFPNVYDKSIIPELKRLDIIPSYDFTFEFYKNPIIDPNQEEDEIGRFVFGKFEEVYNKEKYPPEHLRKIKLVNSYNTLIYGVNFTEFYTESKKGQRASISSHIRGDFRFNQNLFVSDLKYKDIIKEEFFDKYPDICQVETASSYYQGDDYKYGVFTCDPSIKLHKDDFPELKIFSKELNFTFVFGYDDLFREYFGKVYFLIIVPYFYNNNWEIGTIFFKKYKLFFNSDSKDVKFYYKDTSVSNNAEKEASIGFKIFLRIIEFIGVSLLFVLGYYIGKYLNKKRKLRALELEDNYEYTENKKYKNIELK